MSLAAIFGGWLRRLTAQPRPAPEPDLLLSRREAEAARFCFLGEFGYEVVSWLPFLLHLKTALGLRLRTAGRPGSCVFYEFSDDHIEVEAGLIGDVWGQPEAYAALGRRLGERLVHPGRHAVNRREIAVDGCHWTTRNIHKRIEVTNYQRLDFSHLPPYSPLAGRPLAVINNKYFVQWPDTYDAPVNFFDRAALVQLRDLLLRRGYGVIYNHFVEPTSHDRYWRLDDEGLFGELPYTHDLRTDYASAADPAARNRLQLRLYNAAALVIAPQGGNVYLPAVCRRPLLLLMRAGDYVDYLELGRIYETPVDVFYEPRHMLRWLDVALPAAPAPEPRSRFAAERVVVGGGARTLDA